MTQISDGFTKHNIDHLSASSINLYANAPDVWVVSYLFGTCLGARQWDQLPGAGSASKTQSCRS
jgi:hypothetical protein